MEYLLLGTKALFLLFSIVFGGKYIVCVIHSKDITEGVAWRMGFGVTGFITLQWLAQ